MRFVGLVLLLFGTACGGSDFTVYDVAVTFDGGPADAEPRDGARPDAVPPDGPTPDGAVLTNEGIVLLGEINAFGAIQSTAEATLSPGPLLGGPIATVAECKIYGTAIDEGLTAGNISISGANAAVTLIPMGLSPFVDYVANPLPPDDFVTPGQTITASAVGGADIPAFSGSVVVPATITGFTPPSSVDRSAPPTLTWTPSFGDEMWAWIQTFDDSFGDDRLIWCRMPDTGSYSFPVAATSMIPASHTQGFVVLFRTNFTMVDAGSASIALTALVGQSNTAFIPVTP